MMQLVLAALILALLFQRRKQGLALAQAAHARRRGLTKIALAALLIITVRAYVRYRIKAYWAYQPPCHAACPDEGMKGLFHNELMSARVLVPKCCPVKLHFELAKAEALAHRRYTLWYRYSLTNITCGRLSDFKSYKFVPHDGKKSNVHFRVWDPDGKLMEVLDSPTADTSLGGYSIVHNGETTEYGGVIPYGDAWSYEEQLQKDLPSKHIDKFYHDELDPGETVHSAPSKVWPHILGEHDLVGTEGGEPYIGTAIGDVASPIRITPPEPPSGYRIMDQFVFNRPGSYKIQAVYEDTIFLRPIFPNFEARRMPYSEWGDLAPPTQPLEYSVHAESEVVEFMVKP
jgi:hypothetical protein